MTSATCPRDGNALIERSAAWPDQCNCQHRHEASGSMRTRALLTIASISRALPDAIQARSHCALGRSRETIRSFATARFELPVHRFGNVAVGIQPARGYNIDPKATLSRSGPRAAARLSRLLCLAARRLRRRCDHPHWQARQSRMAAGQGAGALGRRAFPKRCSGRCRCSIPSSSTIRARARRPSGAPRR